MLDKVVDPEVGYLVVAAARYWVGTCSVDSVHPASLGNERIPRRGLLAPIHQFISIN